MTVLVIDGQGGGIGGRLISELRASLGNGPRILAVGTNSLATNSMMKAGADAGATGENPVLVNCPKADVILGPLGIVLANAMLGEVTAGMAAAVADSAAEKILIPFSQCSVSIAGVESRPLDFYIRRAVEMVNELPQALSADGVQRK